MSQVTDPVLLDSTGQIIAAGILAVVSAIQSRGMPSPSASNPQMDGTASPGSSNDYARGDHVHPENPANAKTAQLAYVETGTTASRNYTAGQYISLNGLLYTADTAIASGATFYTSGGNKNLTECVGGGFNHLAFPTARADSFTSDNYSVEFIRYGYVCTIRVFRNTSANVVQTLTTSLPDWATPALFIAVPAYGLDSGYIQISEYDGKITVRHNPGSWFSATATYVVRPNT